MVCVFPFTCPLYFLRIFIVCCFHFKCLFFVFSLYWLCTSFAFLFLYFLCMSFGCPLNFLFISFAFPLYFVCISVLGGMAATSLSCETVSWFVVATFFFVVVMLNNLCRGFSPALFFCTLGRDGYEFSCGNTLQSGWTETAIKLMFTKKTTKTHIQREGPTLASSPLACV